MSESHELFITTPKVDRSFVPTPSDPHPNIKFQPPGTPGTKEAEHPTEEFEAVTIFASDEQKLRHDAMNAAAPDGSFDKHELGQPPEVVMAYGMRVGQASRHWHAWAEIVFMTDGRLRTPLKRYLENNLGPPA